MTASLVIDSRDKAIASQPNEGLGRRDLLAVALILCGFGLALLLMPPARNFAILDDFTYVRNVERVVAGQSFRPSEYAQATLLVHTYWGALFDLLFGVNFTGPTLANLTMAFVAAVTFYVLLRRLRLSPLLGGLGVALLCLNPYFINLSYSFMTELTFLAMLLLGCLFYFEGLGRTGRQQDAWLLAGSFFATLAFLTRQFGVALPFAVLLWLFWGRQLSWRRAAQVALLPTLAAVIYFVWSSRLGVTYSSSISREELLDLVRSPSSYVTRASHFVYLALPLPGLLVPLYGRVRRWKVVLPLALVAAVAVFALWQVKSGLLEQGASGGLSELSYYWLGLALRDPTPVYVIGAALTVWLVAGIVERTWPGTVQLIRRKRPPTPTDFLYIVALVLFVGTYVVSAGFLDRYWLPILPFVIAGGLSTLAGARWWRVGLVGFAAGVLGLFGSLVHLDTYDNVNAAWTAARGLVAQGVPYDKIRGDYSWDGYYLFDLALQRVPTMDVRVIGKTFPGYLPGVSDPQYVVQETPQPGYDVIGRYPYLSRLGGFVTREMMVLKRR